MADGNFATLVSKDTSLNASTNPIFTQLTDGTNIIAVTASSELNVLATAQPGTDIGDVTVNNAAGASAVNIQDGGNVISIDDGGGSITIDGTVTATNPSVAVDDAAFTVAVDSVTVVGYLADETTPDSVDEGDLGAARMTLDRRQLMVITDATTATQRLAVAADGSVAVTDNGGSLTIDNSTLAVLGGGTEAAALRVTLANDSTGLLSVDDNGGSLTVDATALDIRTITKATDSIQVSKNTAVNSETNPIFVSTVDAGVSASEVHDYSTATIAGAATSNHDYTVANATFLLKQVDFACSGAMKVEVQTGPVASLASVYVGFVPKAGGEGSWDTHHTPREVPVASTGTVRVIRTNREGSSNDVYSTIIGNDV